MGKTIQLIRKMTSNEHISHDDTLESCKDSLEGIRDAILNAVKGKPYTHIIAFPEYQEGWEGFFYEDIKNNLHHVYYNSTDEIDVAVYDDITLFIKDVIYLNSISLRNYPMGFHLFSKSLSEFVKVIEDIEFKKRAGNGFGKGTLLLSDAGYFPVNEYYTLY